MLLVGLLVAALPCVGAASPAVNGWTGRYTVRAGDSLSQIAQHYGVSLHALADVNRPPWTRLGSCSPAPGYMSRRRAPGCSTSPALSRPIRITTARWAT